MKLAEVIEGYSTLGQFTGKPMNAKLSYMVAKNLRILEPEVKGFDEARNALVTKYSVDGVFPDEIKAQADAEYQTLMETEVTVAVHKIKVADFGALEVTPVQMLALDFIVEE